MKRYNKVLSLLCLVCLLFSALPPISYAATMPKAFWTLTAEEKQKESTGDVQGLINTRKAIIKLFDTWPDSFTDKLAVVTPRYKKIAEAYEGLKQYDQAIEALKKYIYFATLCEKYSGWNHDAVAWAEAKIKGLDLDVDLYVKSKDIERNTYFNAPYEPKSGIYFGSTYDLDDRINSYKWEDISKFFPKKNAAYLMYLDFGEKISAYKLNFEAAIQASTSVQLAWNAYQTYPNMADYKSYIEETALYLKSLNMPVFVRYGSEMNVADEFANAPQFIENFRYVANTLHALAPNVAVVWSPNDITAANRKVEDYYPGDAYVDWVGMSTYVSYYFSNFTTSKENLDTVYFTGPYANALSKVEEIVKKYGDKKPIMLSECGIAHYSKTTQKDMTPWAKIQLQRLYALLPLKYPQIKGIFYFNVDDDITKTASYAFYTNPEMNTLYNQLINNGYFISNVGATADFRYAQIGSRKDKSYITTDTALDLKTLVIVPSELNPKISYEVDGKVLFTTQTIPYDYRLNCAALSEGTHSLKIKVANSNNESIKAKDYTLIKSGSKISLEEGTFVTASFSDIETWSKTFILEIAKREILVGSNHLYKPSNNMTRAEVASIITKIGKFDAPLTTTAFTDVAPSKWYNTYVQIAKDYLPGYGSYYYPERAATREELITAFVKLKGLSPLSLTEEERITLSNGLTDFNTIAPQNKDYILLALKNKIIGGYEDQTLRPKNSMTRGEVAKVLYLLFYQ